MTNKEWIDKGQNSVMKTYGRFPITFVKGKGSRLYGMLTVKNIWIS